jgi:NhaA family Na+:H+ antiporter
LLPQQDGVYVKSTNGAAIDATRRYLGMLYESALNDYDAALIQFGAALEDGDDGELSVIEWLEEKVHPWSSFVIIPLFAFANTGVIITNQSITNAINSPIAWGIFAGLVLGKPIGVLASVILARKIRLGHYPQATKSLDLLATGSAAGIGFTVAIFIANLAFSDPATQDLAIFSVIAASIVSALISLLLFKVVAKKKS